MADSAAANGIRAGQSGMTFVIAFLAWSLSAAFADVAFSLLSAPVDSAEWPAVARLVLGDFVIFGAVFAVASAVAIVWPVRWLPAPRVVIGAALASAAAGLLILASPQNRLLSFYACRPELLICRPYAATFFAPILVGSLALVLVGRALGGEECRQSPSVVAAIVAAPLVSGIGTVSTWYVVYSGPDSRAAALRVVACVIGAVGLAAAVARMAARLDRAAALLTAFIVAIGGLSIVPAEGRAPRQRARHVSGRVAADAPKTVILITIDALRADALSSYGHPGRVTPNIDELAKHGVLFENAMSPAPWTIPSVASLLTGLDPLTHQVGTSTALGATVPTLAESMSDAGYYSAAVVTNWLLTPDVGVSKGFDEYLLMTPPPTMQSTGNGSLVGRVWRRLTLQRYRGDIDKMPASMVTEAALRILGAHKGDRLFLWLHYFDPHQPYAPPAAYVPPGIPAEDARFLAGRFTQPKSQQEVDRAKDLYEAEVQYVDSSLGVLFTSLRAMGVYDSATIVLTADHGEAFWEHGHTGHGVDLYREAVHVPLIVKSPSLPIAARMASPVSTQSVMPTLLDIAHVAHSRDAFSIELLPFQANGDAPPVMSANFGTFVEKVSVLFAGTKYILSTGTNREELYDVDKDRDEQMSLTTIAPEKLAMGRRLLAQRLAEANRVRERDHIVATPRADTADAIRRLKALGYIQ